MGFLYTILKNGKTSLYRKWRTEIRYMQEGHAGAVGEEEGGKTAGSSNTAMI